jgi:hypothetical protein
MLDENEAHAAALRFARSHVTNWSDRKLFLCPVTYLEVEGHFVFGIAAHPYRTAGSRASAGTSRSS